MQLVQDLPPRQEFPLLPPVCIIRLKSTPFHKRGGSLQATHTLSQAGVAQCPGFPLWPDKRRLSGARAALTRLIETWRRRRSDSRSPPANSHMLEPGFLTHELGLILQPGPAQCYCWSSARSRAGAAGFLGPIFFFFGAVSSLDFPAHFFSSGCWSQRKK